MTRTIHFETDGVHRDLSGPNYFPKKRLHLREANHGRDVPFEEAHLVPDIAPALGKLIGLPVDEAIEAAEVLIR